MHKTVRELIKKAETIGWTCDGQLDGGGHFTLIHENGQRYTVAATPSDARSQKNALANLERIAGRKTVRVVRNRSRKKIELYEDTRELTIRSQRRAERARLQAERVETERLKREALLAKIAQRDRELSDLRHLMGGGR